MSTDPRAALSTLVIAFERHLEACAGRHGEDDPGVIAAYDDLVDAFEAYDGALYDATGEMTPFDIYAADDEGDEDDEDDDLDDEDEGDDDEDEDDSAEEPLDGADEIDPHDDEEGDGVQLYAGLDDVDFEDAGR